MIKGYLVNRCLKEGFFCSFCFLKRDLMFVLSPRLPEHCDTAGHHSSLARAELLAINCPVARCPPAPSPFQLQTLMNFKLKGQPNLLSSISLIQYNLFLNSFSHAKASQNDSQQMTDSACKSGQFISSCVTWCGSSRWLDRTQTYLIIHRMASLHFVPENMQSKRGKYRQQQI